ncbi:MAG: M28 family peptidase, partial [Candidatus Binatia bacterium]
MSLHRLGTAILFLVMGFTTQAGATENELVQRLRGHVQVLAGEIGERNPSNYANLERAATYIQDQFKASRYAVESQDYTVGGRVYRNLIVSRPGRAKQEGQIVLGAHYDTNPGTPGADDNASGVSVLLELARLAIDREFGKTVRFVAFSTEEMPLFRTRAMGSHVYARRAQAKGDHIVGMISLEMVGYYSDREGSQSYPIGFSLFYPSRGNFISLVSDFWSRRWKNEVEAALKQSMRLPVESVATFRFVPGV